MKIISFNCNGIRASIQKGLVDFISGEDPDFFCLQETKANPSQTGDDIWKDLGYVGYHHTAEKPGYSSVATYSKTKYFPFSVDYGINHTIFDKEGRSVGLSLPDFYLWNMYFPSGTTGDTRQNLKMEFLSHVDNYTKKLKKKHKKIILCGDVNIAHGPQDIHNPKGNEKNSGYLPEEREWLTNFLKSGWVDSFRYIHPEREEYSWWTYRFQARKNNKGWRIDYFFTTDNLKKKILGAGIFPEFVGSDHAPIFLELSTD